MIDYSSEYLQNCLLFRGMEPEEIRRILQSTAFTVQDYPKDRIIALEEDRCSALGIVLQGRVDVQKIFTSGKIVSMARLLPGDMFGEAIIFTQSHQYPATIMAMEKSLVMYIKDLDVVDICSKYPVVLRNFMELLSMKIFILNKKIRDLSFETVREKIASFLLEEFKKQKSETLTLPYSKKVLADHMGIQRPSLSRELIKMREEGLLDFQGNQITIQDLEGIESFLY